MCGLLQACEGLNENDLNVVGEAMYKTHEGLSHDYEVSCPELDYLVFLVKDAPGVYGARMMGGGFGGCTINLVAKDRVADVGEVGERTSTGKNSIMIRPCMKCR